MKEVLARLSYLIGMFGEINDSKTARHFYRLRERLIKGQKLTKKMQEHLGGIKADLKKESDLRLKFDQSFEKWRNHSKLE